MIEVVRPHIDELFPAGEQLHTDTVDIGLVAIVVHGSAYLEELIGPCSVDDLGLVRHLIGL